MLLGIDQTRQTKYIVMTTKNMSNKIVNFMTPGAGVVVLERGHISHTENVLIFKKPSIYT